MSIGVTPTVQGLNQQASQILLSLRQDMYAVMAYNAYIQQLGATGLQAIGFTSDDAANLLAVFGNVDAVRAMAMGVSYGGPDLPHDFMADCTPLWGGQ